MMSEEARVVLNVARNLARYGYELTPFGRVVLEQGERMERMEAESAEERHNLLAIVMVRQLHSKRTVYGEARLWEVCAECRQAWPCETEQVLLEILDLPGPADDGERFTRSFLEPIHPDPPT